MQTKPLDRETETETDKWLTVMLPPRLWDVCVCVCVRERERKIDRQTDRQTDRTMVGCDTVCQGVGATTVAPPAGSLQT